jgi:hypothetical protein
MVHQNQSGHVALPQQPEGYQQQCNDGIVKMLSVPG